MPNVNLKYPITPRLRVIIDAVVEEFVKASAANGRFHGPHEGYGVLLEEVDELWDNIKCNAPPSEHYAEAKQVAAMAIRYMHDVCFQDE